MVPKTTPSTDSIYNLQITQIVSHRIRNEMECIVFRWFFAFNFRSDSIRSHEPFSSKFIIITSMKYYLLLYIVAVAVAIVTHLNHHHSFRFSFLASLMISILALIAHIDCVLHSVRHTKHTIHVFQIEKIVHSLLAGIYSIIIWVNGKW